MIKIQMKTSEGEYRRMFLEKGGRFTIDDFIIVEELSEEEEEEEMLSMADVEIPEIDVDLE
jgi:hypothetical protein